MTSPTPPPASASTEDMSVFRSPGLAETLPPSGMLNLQRPAAAAPLSSASPTEPATAAALHLQRVSNLVDREFRNSASLPAAKSTPLAKPSPPKAPAQAPAQAPAPPAPAAGTTDEEPLETYLDRFMERLTGKRPEAPESVSQTVPGMPVFPTKPVTPAPIAAPAPPPASLPPPLREPTKPPECRQSLSAMRELANENARSAVALHASVDLSGRAKLALVAAASFSLFSCGLASAAIVLHSRTCLWTAGIAGCLAAVIACRFFLLCRQFQPAMAQSWLSSRNA